MPSGFPGGLLVSQYRKKSAVISDYPLCCLVIFPLLDGIRDEWPYYTGYCNEEENAGDWASEELSVAAMGIADSSSEVSLKLWLKNECQYKWGSRKTCDAHEY